MSPRRDPAPPPELPGHQYVRILGSGGFADVFLYERELPRMPVAVKVLVGGILTREDEQRFTAEANTMARFSAHPYIVGIQNAAVSSDGRPYIVMQYYPKDNLAIRCRRQQMTVADTLQIGIQVASAVETAHQAGILHRDIKPANILTGEFGEPGLTDFGIAAATTGSTAAQRDGEGLSIPWSPPEAFDSDTVLDERSDVYSLGATVYNLLTGRSPFEVAGEGNSAIDLMERIERWPVPRIDRGDIPPSLSRVLSQAMAKQPEQRHPSALALARDLQAVEQELHLKMTTVIVPNETVDLGTDGGYDGPDETRGRAPVRIDAQALADQGGSTRQPAAAFSPGSGGLTEDRPDPTAQRGAGALITSGDPFAGDMGPLSHAQGPPGTVPAAAPYPPGPAPRVDEITGTRKRITVRADQSAPEAAEPAPAPKNRRATLVGAIVVLVIAAVVGVSLALGSSTHGSSGSATTTSAPSVSGNVFVPVPTNVAATLDTTSSGTTATVTWTDPDPQPDDFFEVTGPNGVLKQTSADSTSFSGWNPATPFCATVMMVRKNGQASNPSQAACSS